MPVLSVLIPTFNRPFKLEKALASLRHLQADLEVIVGNNGEVDPVSKVIQGFSSDLIIKQLNNRVGSSYPDNIKLLVAAASCEWMTILHDDDFFTHEASCIRHYFSEEFDFIFSDHWIADHEGKLIPDKTDLNSKAYGRSSLLDGPVKDLETLWIKNTICLDCFFVRTHIAKSCLIDVSLGIFADILLLAQVASRVHSPRYIAVKCFAYRLSDDSLTSKGLPQDELLNVLQRCLKFVRQALCSLRFSLKRARLRSAVSAAQTLFYLN
jgi:hypothetical protein